MNSSNSSNQSSQESSMATQSNKFHPQSSKQRCSEFISPLLCWDDILECVKPFYDANDICIHCKRPEKGHQELFVAPLCTNCGMLEGHHNCDCENCQK